MFLRQFALTVLLVTLMSPVFAIDSESVCGEDFEGVVSGSIEMEAIWHPNCSPGQYLPQGSTVCAPCLANSYCPGGGLNEEGPAETDMFITACAPGLKSQVGSRTASDCGRILHVGDSVIYLHTDKRTTPSLNVDIDNDGVTDYYADVTPVSEGAKAMASGDTKTLRVSYQGQEYTIHSTIYE